MDKEFDIKINIGIKEAKNLVKYLKFNYFQVPTNSELESLKDGELIIKYCGISYYIKK